MSEPVEDLASLRDAAYARADLAWWTGRPDFRRVRVGEGAPKALLNLGLRRGLWTWTRNNQGTHLVLGVDYMHPGER